MLKLYNVRRALVLAIVVVLAFSLVRVLFDSKSSFRVSGVITSVPISVYWDANCSTPVNSIDWGNLAAGSVETLTMYVRNLGNESVFLAVNAINWNAGNTSDVATFSSEEPIIGPRQVVQVDPTLTVFPNASGVSNFSFDVAFSASGGLSVGLSDFVDLFSNNTSVMIYPSTSTSKPLGCGAALIMDKMASMFVSTKLSNCTEGPDTQAAFVDQTSGRPLGASGTGIISFGGPLVNLVVRYAENLSTPSADRAPIRFNSQNGVFSFQYANGSSIPGTSTSSSALNGTQDFFVIETFMDGGGRYQMLCYGFDWEGTYAAGLYFDTAIYPNLASQNESWIIVNWNDTNGDGLVNGPGGGDTYTVIAQGS